jgi:hypothetical protein
VFSLTCGVTLAAGGAFVAEPWDLGPAMLPPAVGLGVTAFGFLLARLAVLPVDRLRRGALFTLAADLSWVLGSVGLIVLHPLPTAATVVVIVVATVVTIFAGWQLSGRVAAHRDDPLADLDVVQSSRVFAASPDRVWPLLTDHDLYGRLAPNLSRVEVISTADQPLRRRCVNTAGRAWEESCTLLDPGHRFAVHVDTTDYPYPLTLMRGLWQVDPHPHGSHVTMRFAFQATPTMRGGVFTIAFRALFPLALTHIFQGWQQQLRSPDGEPRQSHRGDDS